VRSVQLASCKKKGFRVLHASRGAQAKQEIGANSRRNNSNNSVISTLFYFTVAIASNWHSLLPISKILTFFFLHSQFSCIPFLLYTFLLFHSLLHIIHACMLNLALINFWKLIQTCLLCNIWVLFCCKLEWMMVIVLKWMSPEKA